jgi:mannosyltransferase
MNEVIATTGKAASFLDRPAIISHHGVDAELYHPPHNRSAIRAELGLADRPTLAVFGRIAPKKGIGDLVEALESVLPKFPQWQIILVGETTPDQAGFHEGLSRKLTAAELHDRVHFTGFLKNFSELPRWYQAADVVGCVSRNEGFGVTCLEGMASGCPVLATEAGAWPDIITPGQDGWIARAADPLDLERALQTVFSTSPEMLRRMGENARTTILNRFTISHEYLRIIAVYDDLFQKFGRADWREANAERPSSRRAA